MKRIIKSLVAGTAMVGIAGVASATPSIYVSSTGLAGSYSAVAVSPSGILSWAGSSGVWNVVLTTGFTAPAVGSLTAPTFDLDITGSTTGAGSLWVAIAANNFNDPLGGIIETLSGHIVSGAGANYTQTTFADTSNTQPTTTLPTGVNVASQSGSLPAPANSSAMGLLPWGTPATLGEVVELDATGITSVSVDTSFTSAPDGGATAMMLGAALSGLALLKRKVLA